MFLRANEWGGHVAGMVSEELEDVYTLPAQYPRGKYLLLFDPLDGSSNIDVNVSVGQHLLDPARRHARATTPTLEDFLQPGTRAGVRRLCDLRPVDDAGAHAGHGHARLHARPAARRVGAEPPEPAHSREDTRVRDQRVEQPLLGAGRASATSTSAWPAQTGPRGARLQHALDRVAGGRDAPHPDARRRVPVSARHARTRRKPGRLRLLYEANPIALLIEQAGGRASTGRTRACSRSSRRALHQRVRLRVRLARGGRAHRALPPRGAARHLRRRRCSARAACSATPMRGRCNSRMSAKHPIIAITGSSGAGTTSVTRTFEQIFRREGVKAAVVEGDSFHRYDRAEMKARDGRGRRPRQPATSATSAPRPTCSRSWRRCSATTPRRGTGQRRKYLHDDEEAAPYGSRRAPSPPWEDAAADTDLLFYEGLHGAVMTDDGRRGAPRRPADRRGAGDQPRVDPEDPPRQERRAATPPRR